MTDHEKIEDLEKRVAALEGPKVNTKALEYYLTRLDENGHYVMEKEVAE